MDERVSYELNWSLTSRTKNVLLVENGKDKVSLNPGPTGDPQLSHKP